MEPIELSGKTFCSNCGLAVGVTPPSAPSAPISSFPQNRFGDTVIPRTEASVPVDVPSTPVKDETKRELGLDVDGPNDLIPSTPVNPGVKLSVSSDEPTVSSLQALATPPKEPDNVEQLLSEISGINLPTSPTPIEIPPVSEPVQPETPLEKVTRVEDRQIDEPQIWGGGSTESIPEEIQQPEIAPVPELPEATPVGAEIENVPPLAREVDVPDESDFDEIPKADNHQRELNEDKIKEVDTLGASGILLDILGDEIDQHESEAEITNLEAAEALIDDLDFEPKSGSEIPESAEKVVQHDESASETDEAETLSDILDDKPQNPVEYPELTSPLDELELEPGDKETEGKTKTPEEEAIAEADPEDELYTLPHKLNQKGTGKGKPSKVEEKPAEEKPAEEKPEEEIKKIEATIAKAKLPEISVNEDQADEIDPDTIPKTAVIKPDKQAVLADYFRAKMTNNKPNNKASFLKPKIKTKDKGKKKFSFGSWLVPAIIGGTLFVLLAGGGIAYVIFSKVPTKVTHTTPAGIGFEPQLPTNVVENYILSDSSSDDAAHSFVVKYTLTDDSSKTIVYTQAKPESLDGYVAKYTSAEGAAITKKTLGDIEYTNINDKTLLWTKSGLVYTIETSNYNKSVDLLYQMAQSVS